MCRYSFTTYKPHLACFRCRKSFKRRLKQDIDPAGSDKPPKCPDCGGAVADMGLDFKAPSRGRVAQWTLLEELFTIGVTFHSCGCSGPGYRPRARSELHAFLVQTIQSYETQLDHWTAGAVARGAPLAERTAAMLHWHELIAAARAALARV
jgi:hypothetical protein